MAKFFRQKQFPFEFTCEVQNASVFLGLFSGRFVGVVTGMGIEHGLVQCLIDGDGVEEALTGHVAVEVACEVVRCHDAGDRAVVLVDLFFQILLPASSTGSRQENDFLTGKCVSVSKYKVTRLVLRIDQRNLLRRMLGCDGGAFKQNYDSRIVHPGAQDRIEREAPPSEVIVEIFLFERMWSFVCNLPSLRANGYSSAMSRSLVSSARSLSGNSVKLQNTAPPPLGRPWWKL